MKSNFLVYTIFQFSLVGDLDFIDKREMYSTKIKVITK